MGEISMLRERVPHVRLARSQLLEATWNTDAGAAGPARGHG